MRAIGYLTALGLLFASMYLGAADKDAKKPPQVALPARGATATPAAKAKPAEAAATKAVKPADDDEQLGVTDNSETPDKYAADKEAILDTAEAFVKAYVNQDAAAIAALFSPDAEYIDESGTEYRGRDEIETTLKEFIKDHPKASLSLEIESLRFLTPELAVEDGASMCVCDEGGPAHRSRYTAIHTKVDGKWLVASSREKSIGDKREHAARLKDLDWLVGEWIDQDDDSVVHFRCDFSDDGNYLLRDFTVSVAGEKVITGTQRIGWDPAAGKLRAWTFDSDGGFFEGVWYRDEDKWFLTARGITSDGEEASGTAIYTPVNRHTMTWQAVNRLSGGTRTADSEEFTLVRMAPGPEKMPAPEKPLVPAKAPAPEKTRAPAK